MSNIDWGVGVFPPYDFAVELERRTLDTLTFQGLLIEKIRSLTLMIRVV